ncbi:hypothetical protein VIGAN_07112000, partial [Vigna angularis var. angularis]
QVYCFPTLLVNIDDTTTFLFQGPNASRIPWVQSCNSRTSSKASPPSAASPSPVSLLDPPLYAASLGTGIWGCSCPSLPGSTLASDIILSPR